MTATVYEVAVKLSTIDGVSSVMAALAKTIVGVDGNVKALEKTLGSLNKTSMAVYGSLSMIGGAAVLAGFGKLASHGDKLLDQQDKLQRAGMRLNDVLKIQADYYNRIAQSVPTSTGADYLRTYNELRSVVGAERAGEKTPWAMKLESIMSNMTGQSAEGQGFKILRALEMKGITLSDPAMSDRLSDIMMKNIIGSGGKLSATDFEQMAKTGGAAWIKAAPQFIAGPLSNIASDMGGSRTGTALMTLYQLFSGATQIGKLQAAELEKLGIIKPGMLVANKGGDASGVKPGGIVGWEIAASDPYKWVNDVLMPHMRSAYGNDPAAIEASLAKIGRNRNAIRMLTMMSDPGFREQMAKDTELWGQSSSIDKSYSDAMARNPKFVKQAFSNQYESMMQAIGAPMMQAAIPVMQAVTGMFTTIGAFANAHPDAIKMIGAGIAGIGAALVGAGGLAIAAAIGPAGWLIGGIVGLGAAFAAFPKAGADIVKTTVEWLKKAVEAIDAFAGSIGRLIASIPGSLASGASGLWGGLKAGASNYWGNLKGAFGFGTGPAIARSGSEQEHLDWTAAYAASRGLNPEVIKRVMGSEGLHTYVGDGGSSFGDFQLHKGGIAGGGNRFSGLGDIYERQTGHRLTDAADWKSQNKWAVDWIARTNNLSPWHGWKGHPGAAKAGVSAPPRPVLENHTHVYLDGEKIAKSTERRMIGRATHSRQAPFFNGNAMFTGPDHSFAAG